MRRWEAITLLLFMFAPSSVPEGKGEKGKRGEEKEVDTRKGREKDGYMWKRGRKVKIKPAIWRRLAGASCFGRLVSVALPFLLGFP